MPKEKGLPERAIVPYVHQKRWLIALFTLLCIGAAWYFTSRLDIGLYDETAYLGRGLAIPTQGLPTGDMAPVYSLWYFLLHKLIADPVDLYFLSHGITIAALPIVCLFLLRAMGVRWNVCMIISCFILLSTLNVLSWPHVSVFAVIILLLGSLCFASTSMRSWRFIPLISSTALAVFIRPEFVLSLGLFIAWWSWTLYSQKDIPLASRMLRAGILGGSVLIIFQVFGDPLANGRSIVAFGQHYAVNKVKAEDLSIDPWTNWELILEHDFGAVDGLCAALAAAPDKMAWHVMQNIKATPNALTRSLMPAGMRPSIFAQLLVVTFIVALCATAFVRREQWKVRLRETMIAAIILALPALVSMLVIHPREHYVLFPLCLMLLPLLAGVFSGDDRIAPSRPAFLVLVISACAVPLLGRNMVRERPVLATIEELRALPVSPDLKILDADGGYGVYLPFRTVRVQAQEKDSPFTSWSAEKALDVIIVSPRLRADHRYNSDKTWEDFLAGGYEKDFIMRHVTGSDVYLLIAKHVLAQD